MDSNTVATNCVKTASKHVVIVGLGNIGSYVSGQTGRLTNVERATLIDYDHYEKRNFCCQDIEASDVNKPKVEVQARRLRRINPAIVVRPICRRVEQVPLGLLRADAIIGGLDSRKARQYVNQAAWRLGVPWIDAAVDAAGLLVRVNVHVPGDGCCGECSWDTNDYSALALEQTYPCDKLGHGTPATNAPASVGAVAAGIVSIELRKLFDGDTLHLLSGRQVMLDLKHHTHYVTAIRRNARCRFDHQVWQIEKLAALPSRVTLGQAIQLATGSSEGGSDCALGMEGHYFAAMQFCPGCGNHVQNALCLADQIPTHQRICEACGGEMVVRGFDMIETLEGAMLGKRQRRRLLSSFGFRPGDVITVRGPEGQRHLELGGHRPKGSSRRRTRRPTATVAK